MRTVASCVLVVLLLGAAAVPAGATAQEAQAYSGTHVSFETTGDGVVDYSVDGETVLDSVAVQSRSSAQTDLGVDIGLSAITDVTASSLSLASQTSVNATVEAESGARMEAHDNSNGILVVSSGSESQYVVANLSSTSEAESESDQRAVVTTENGTEGTFVVVGDGEIATNDGGNVSARLESGAELVFRSYSDGRSESDEREESYIAEGKATAEVYVMESAESSGEFTSDVITYGEDTSVEVTEQSEGAVTMTANRTQEEGTIVLTTVSERAISSTDDLSVSVDGETAAEASSYSELESATGGDSSMYFVSESSAEAGADVLVAVDHFSEREVQMTEGGASDGSDGEDADGTSSSGPGFGPALTLVALLAAAALALHRRD